MTTKKEVKKAYRGSSRKKLLFSLSLIALTFFVGLIAVRLGPMSISLKKVLVCIFGEFLPIHSTTTEAIRNVILICRLPRICMAIVAGMGLAMAGAVMQNILRNPLASPYTLGVASGAGFGAALAIVLGAGIASYGGVEFTQEWLIVINAFVFSLIPTFVILGITKLRSATPGTMVLAGIAMMYLFSALLSLLQYMGTEEEVTAVVYWLFGSLSKASWSNTTIVFGVTFPLAIFLLFKSWDFNAFSAGDEVAASLGVNVESTRLIGMLVASLMTAISVCFLGTIGFIGLVAPHITRMVIGGDHRFLLPTSCLVGAITLLVSDTLARTIVSPLLLPVGIVTSFLGVPLFLYLLIRRRREYW